MQFRLVIICFSALLAAVASQRTGESTYKCAEHCYPGICRTVKCGLREDQCKDGIARDGAGYCSCCNNCIKPLKLGDSCNPLPGYGVPNPVEYCDYGLTCDCKKKICVPCKSCIPDPI
uniref:U58-Liphistoxin-Lsp1c_1 n=1 Tax=Liphistius sp. SGP-2016 TaxID=1905180 RepID=A0A4Q8K533_9ARAC